MFKDQIVKVELAKAAFGGEGSEHEISMRFDFKVPLKFYEKIHPTLGKLAEQMANGDGTALPQLHWNYDSMPCTMVVGPTREDVEGKATALCVDLGTLKFDKKLMLITRKDRADEDAAPDLYLYATTRIKKTVTNTKFANDYFKVGAYCRIRTPQQQVEAPPEDEEGDNLEQ